LFQVGYVAVEVILFHGDVKLLPAHLSLIGSLLQFELFLELLPVRLGFEHGQPQEFGFYVGANLRRAEIKLSLFCLASGCPHRLARGLLRDHQLGSAFVDVRLSLDDRRLHVIDVVLSLAAFKLRHNVACLEDRSRLGKLHERHWPPRIRSGEAGRANRGGLPGCDRAGNAQGFLEDAALDLRSRHGQSRGRRRPLQHLLHPGAHRQQQHGGHDTPYPPARFLWRGGNGLQVRKGRPSLRLSR
jgi:hypothetical protein